MKINRIVSTDTKYSSLKTNARARELRKDLTPQEKRLWDRIRRGQLNGMHFRKQHPYNIYILDFFCFKANLAIEVEGKIHLRRKEYDKERTRFLESTGLVVLHFRNEDIENRIDLVIEIIKKHLQDN